MVMILIKGVSTLLMLLKDCWQSAFRCYCVLVCVTIAIAIVGLRSGCSCCCEVLIAIVIGGSRSGAAVLFRLHLETNMLIEDVSTLMKGCCLLIRDPMPVHVLMLLSVYHDYYCHCHCHCWIAFRCGVPLALGEKDIMVTKMFIKDALTLLMLIMDC